jgi:hypothetical protein
MTASPPPLRHDMYDLMILRGLCLSTCSLTAGTCDCTSCLVMAVYYTKTIQSLSHFMGAYCTRLRRIGAYAPGCHGRGEPCGASVQQLAMRCAACTTPRAVSKPLTGRHIGGGKYGIVSCHRDVTGALSLVFPPTELPARFRYTTGHLTGEDDLRGRCSARHGIQAAFSRGINTAQGRRTNAYRRRRTASAHASLPLGTMTN